MKEAPLWLRRLAAVLSFLGHPLLAVPAFVGLLVGPQLSHRQAAWALGSMLLLVLPLGLWNLRQTKRGAYSNFDVSEARQRRSFYPVLLVLLGLGTAVLFWQQEGGPFRYGVLVVWAMLLLCYLLNFWLKVSLHAAISFFLAGAAVYLYPGWGGLALLLAVLVAASRWVLDRHTPAELLAGAALGGAAYGGLLWLLEQPLPG
ncbi:hypothetical protein GCM10023185_16870 [Hymenobacter saemangeumensis]|uniref:Phosphatidic acid phosphatase type 2/haloperoxidase domain-containing protein n=1 Tax=Hymenobacter saemangeumensis TaxID=1084522 RepID=A0ABP8IAK3_9BACT